MNRAEVHTGEGAWQVLPGFSGVEEHGMSDMGNRRQPGRPGDVPQGRGESPTSDNKARRVNASSGVGWLRNTGEGG